MRKNWILPGTICLTLLSCSQNADKTRDWTYYVRTAGHGCRIDQIHSIMENANQSSKKNIIVTFNKVKRNSQIEFILFLGHSRDLKGEWNKGNLVVTLPEISRGAIIRLK